MRIHNACKFVIKLSGRKSFRRVVGVLQSCHQVLQLGVVCFECERFLNTIIFEDHVNDVPQFTQLATDT